MSLKHSPSYLLGVVCGMAAAIILVSIIKRFVLKQGRKTDRTYDERQQLVIGKAYKRAFFTLLSYNCAAGLLSWRRALCGAI